MEREDVERHDFPVGRRGYDPAAVDAHLRRVADEVETLRSRAASGLSAGASDRVREILEAAERSATGIREQAGRDAGEHVARVAEAAAAMTSRIDQLQRELDGLLEALARLREDVGGTAGAPAEPEPEPLVDEPPPAAGGEAPDEAGARLIALNMALGGAPREETARYLAEHYELGDAEAMLDDVYRRAGA